MATRNQLAVKVHTGAVDADFINFVQSQPKVFSVETSSDHFTVILDTTATNTDISNLKTAMLNKFIEAVTIAVSL